MATINSVSRRFGVLLGCLWGAWAGEAAVFQSGTSFAEGAWDEMPVAGGAADLSIEIGAASPWSVVNDLGVSGWLTLNQLTTLTAGTISGMDGLAFASNAGEGASWQVAGTVVCDVPVRLDSELTVTAQPEGSPSLEFKKHMSGSGDLRVAAPNLTVAMRGIHLGTGDIRVDQGLMSVGSPDALGAATVHVDDETVVQVEKCLQIECPTGELTITNAFVLGTEETCGWGARLRIKGDGDRGNGGTVHLTGPLSVHRTKVMSEWASDTHVRGGATGDKIVLYAAWDSAIYVADQPLTLTEALWVGGDGVVYLNVKGSSFPALYGFGLSTRLVCGDAGVLPANANFVSQNNDGSHLHVDLNGFDQEVGSFTGEGDAVRPFTFMNSKAGTCPTVTINQRVDTASTNLCFDGTLNVLKKGARVLTWAHYLKGKLIVREGTIMIGGDLDGVAEEVVVESGACLDLGGHSVRLKRLLVKDGGIVCHGTLACQTCEIEGGACADVDLAGVVEKTGSGTLALKDGATVGIAGTQFYDLPEGTAVYFPFDGSLEAACRDRSGYAVQLVVEQGAPVYCAEGRSGGCLYFNGVSSLKASAFPQSIPLGDVPYTVATWVKIGEGCSVVGGWVGYGTTANGCCNNFRLNVAYNSIWNYWWAADVGCGMPNDGTFEDRQWHYVVGTYNGAGERKIYVDGVCMTVNTDFRLNLGNAGFVVGRTLGDACMKGWIDDILIVNRALSQDEITALYEQGGVKQVTREAEFRVSGGTIGSANDGLVCCYHFDSAETLLDDTSGYGITLTRGGDVDGSTFSADSPNGTGGSLRLNGNAYLTAATFPVVLPVKNEPRSIACFLKMATDCQAEGACVNWGAPEFAYHNCNVALRDGGSQLALSPWGFDSHRVYVGRDNLVDQWHSFVVTWDGQSLTYFLDGNQVGEPQKYDFAFDTYARDFMIGFANYEPLSWFKGNLDEVMVWNRVITAEEVAAYHNHLLPQGNPLASGTRLTVTGDGVVDVGTSVTLGALSGDGTVNGDVTLVNGFEATVVHGGPVTINGTLTIAGGGTIVLPEMCSEDFAVYPLFEPGELVGEANLSTWNFINVPDKKRGFLRVRNNVVEAVVGATGMSVFIR